MLTVHVMTSVYSFHSSYGIGTYICIRKLTFLFGFKPENAQSHFCTFVFANIVSLEIKCN